MTKFIQLQSKKTKLAVVGLGYVGLPIAVAMSEHFDVIGYDQSKYKIDQYIDGNDLTGDIGNQRLSESSVHFTTEEAYLLEASFYIVAVPTPIRSGNVPDLKYVEAASEVIARHLKKGDIVVFESTVYPGVTEEVCLPILESVSGLQGGEHFKIGYSPERINPGDKLHTLENIVKVVSGMDASSLEDIAKVYEKVVHAGIYRAPSIKVAEAAKVIENAQRDVNIAFVNELSMIFNQMGIRTQDVLKAAGTKWNFLNFTPGLVGGHCIGIDPYYLTYKAEDEGYHSNIILNSRHINDGMGKFVANQMVKQVLRANRSSAQVKVALLGMTYKENSHDVRNSKVFDVVKELKEYGIIPYIYDPIANKEEIRHEYQLELNALEDINDVSLVAIMVPHEQFLTMPLEHFMSLYDQQTADKLFFDIKGIFEQERIQSAGMKYWSL